MVYVYTFQCKSITFVHYHFCLRQRDETCTLARKEMTKMVMQILEFEELSNIYIQPQPMIVKRRKNNIYVIFGRINRYDRTGTYPFHTLIIFFLVLKEMASTIISIEVLMWYKIKLRWIVIHEIHYDVNWYTTKYYVCNMSKETINNVTTIYFYQLHHQHSKVIWYGMDR